MEMVRQHHRLNGHEFEQSLGNSEGQGNMVCCRPWGYKELDMTQQLNNNNHIYCMLQFLEGLYLQQTDSMTLEEIVIIIFAKNTYSQKI